MRSAGFIEASLIRSQNVLNFAYTLYLKLRVQGYESHLIEHYVRRWLVLSMLLGRYSSASETQFDYDIRQIASETSVHGWVTSAAGHLRDVLDGGCSSTSIPPSLAAPICTSSGPRRSALMTVASYHKRSESAI